MEQLAKAALLVQWASGTAPELIEVQYNPTELSYDKGVQLAELGLKSWAERRWIDVPALNI